MMMLAFLLFFLIVAAECFLIVWLPWHLRLDGMWAEQVAQQELIERFDFIRFISRAASGKLAKPASAEAAIISRSLDRAAAYMHQYSKVMTAAQCRSFMDVLARLGAQFHSINRNNVFSQAVELDNTRYLKSLQGCKSPAQVKK